MSWLLAGHWMKLAWESYLVGARRKIESVRIQARLRQFLILRSQRRVRQRAQAQLEAPVVRRLLLNCDFDGLALHGRQRAHEKNQHRTVRIAFYCVKARLLSSPASFLFNQNVREPCGFCASKLKGSLKNAAVPVLLTGVSVQRFCRSVDMLQTNLSKA